jgi:hypothetical protein
MLKKTLVRIAAAICIASAIHGAIQAESIRPGSPKLNPGALQPGVTTMESFRLEKGTKIPVATILNTITLEKQGDTPVIRVVTRNRSGLADTSRSEIIVDAKTYALISERVRATADSGQVTYHARNIKGWTCKQNDSLHHFEFKDVEPTFPDDGALPWLVCSLPLAKEASFELLSFNMWAKREMPLTYTVVREDTVRYQGALDTCWVVQVTGRGGPPGFDYFNWVSQRSRHLLKAAFLRSDAPAEFWMTRR